jgi:hypothetical protein
MYMYRLQIKWEITTKKNKKKIPVVLSIKIKRRIFRPTAITVSLLSLSP